MLAPLNGTIDMTDSFLPVDQVERMEKSANAHVAKNVTMRLLVIRMSNTKAPRRSRCCRTTPVTRWHARVGAISFQSPVLALA